MSFTPGPWGAKEETEHRLFCGLSRRRGGHVARILAAENRRQ